MDRFLDKAIIAACCLAVCGCMLAESESAAHALAVGDAQNLAAADAQTLSLAIGMLGALACSAAFEIAPAPFNALAPSVYCLAALVCGQAAAFIPLAAYDFMRCLFRPDASRASGLLALAALAACIARGTLPPVATAVLICITATAAALSVRTSSAEARQRIAYRTRDALKSQAISLRSKNRDLTEALEELESETADRMANANPDAPDQPANPDAAEPPRPAAFACLTEREWEVARLVAEGLDNREIAAEAYLSEGTVRNNISAILTKMALKNRTQIAVAFWKSKEN